MKIEFLQAGNGDSILINVENKNILIDGGVSDTYYDYLKNEFENIKQNNQNIDLIVLTHIDNDHIIGILKIFRDKKYVDLIKEFWFNSGEKLKLTIPKKQKSFANAPTLKQYIENNTSITHKYSIFALQKYYLYNLELTILSPNIETLEKFNCEWEKKAKKQMTAKKSDYKSSIEELIQNKFNEDDSPTNGASIAILLKYNNLNYLFLGDSYISVVNESLKTLGYSKLKVELVKLSHHGSKYNLDEEFLELIECDKFIISTNGKKHPNKETLAKIVNHFKDSKEITKLIFNYDNRNLRSIFKKEEKEKYNFETIFNNGYEYVL